MNVPPMGLKSDNQRLLFLRGSIPRFGHEKRVVVAVHLSLLDTSSESRSISHLSSVARFSTPEHHEAGGIVTIKAESQHPAAIELE